MSHKIHLWSAETPELQKELPGHPIGIASLTFTPDGKKFASAGFDRTLKERAGNSLLIFTWRLFGAGLQTPPSADRRFPAGVGAGDLRSAKWQGQEILPQLGPGLRELREVIPGLFLQL